MKVLLACLLIPIVIILAFMAYLDLKSGAEETERERRRQQQKEEEERRRRARFVQVPDGATPEQIRALYRDGNEPGTCWICGELNGEDLNSIRSRRPCYTCQRKYDEVLKRGGPMPDGFNIYNFSMRLWGNLMIISARYNEGLIDEEEARRQTNKTIADERRQMKAEEDTRKRNMEEHRKHQQALDDAESTMRNLMS